jgi:hypothetical protein
LLQVGFLAATRPIILTFSHYFEGVLILKKNNISVLAKAPQLLESKPILAWHPTGLAPLFSACN